MLTISALVLFSGLSAPNFQARLPKAKRKLVRENLAALLQAERSAKRKKLIEETAELAEEYLFDDLIEAVRLGPIYPRGLPEARQVAGEQEELERFGSVIVGYTFEHDGESYRYAVDVPDGYDSKVARGLLLDPGHGSGADADAEGKAGFLGMYRNHVDGAGRKDWLVVRSEIIEAIGAGGKRGQLPEDEVVAVFLSLFRDVSSRFNVDLDRIYVAGISQTGFWSWYLGLGLADRLAGIAPAGAVTWQSNKYLSNYQNLPVYAVHGNQDTICPVVQPRATCAALARLGSPVVYQEVNGGHDFSVWKELEGAIGQLAERPRNPYPVRISKNLQTLRSPWAYWLRVDELEDELDGKAGNAPSGGIDAELVEQTVHLYSEGVRRVTLGFSAEMLDLERPIEVVWNGKTVHEGLLERNFGTTLELAVEKCDWRGSFAASLSLRAPR